MPSQLPSFIRLHSGLNAIAKAFLRRAFAGAILAQRHFRRSPHTIAGAACGSERAAKPRVDCVRRAHRAPISSSPRRDDISRDGAPFARPQSMEAGATVATCRAHKYLA
jgi:hypothetical protein